jgi:hypothetical protein
MADPPIVDMAVAVREAMPGIAESPSLPPDATRVELLGLQQFLSDVVQSTREQEEEIAGREVEERQLSSGAGSSKRTREWGSMVDVEMGRTSDPIRTKG